MDIRTKHYKSEAFTLELLNFINSYIDKTGTEDGEILVVGVLNVLVSTVMTGVECGMNKDELINAVIGDFKDIFQKEYIARQS